MPNQSPLTSNRAGNPAPGLARVLNTSAPKGGEDFKGVSQLVAEWAARTPNALALKSGAESFTYEELDRAASQLANQLVSLGVGPETIVGICLNRSIDAVVSALAIFKARGAYLPLDPSYPRERLSLMLNDAQPRAVITRREFAPQLPRGSWTTILLDDRQTQIEGNSPAAQPGPDDLAYVIYTSGSTGEPKGVEVTHANLMNLISWHRNAFAVMTEDRASLLAAVSFDASVWETWPYLCSGASLHLPDEDTRVSPERLRDWLVAEAISISFLPTVLAEQLMSLPWPARTALRYLLTGADTLHRFPPAGLPFVVINNYGPTECTVVSTSGTVASKAGSENLPTIGRPITNTQIYVLDNQLQQAPVETIGELYIGGAAVARGYLNRPELTRERFIKDPFNPSGRLYRTGDLARLLANGEVAYVGRADNQVKVMGYRIEPDEIVAVLNRHPEVQSSVVVAREIACGEKQLAAYLVPAGDSLTAEDLRDFLSSELPDHMVPPVFVRLESLPLTQNGKIDKSGLPAPNAENTLWEHAFTAPRTPLEERLVTMLSSLLGIDAVSVNDNFFLLGGHSLLGTQLIGQIRNAFGVDLALRSLFDAPTIAELAGEIESLLRARVEAMSEDEVVRLLA